MALPLIKINSASGSDTLASGAGPGTALTGTAAASDGTNGKTITISDAVNLSGVATDGSAVLFINDSTTGNRNFDNITAISGSSGAWTVTVQNGFHISLSGKSWAIGGKRASLGSSSSVRLISNNSASGDAMPGWIMEMESGHSETITATIGCYRAGDTTNGPITLRGTSGAATRPLLTFSNNGDAFNTRNIYWVFRDFELQNSAATKTLSYGFDLTTSASNILIKNIKISHPIHNFFGGFTSFLNGQAIIVEDCEFGHCAGHGISTTGGTITVIRIENCWIHDNSGSGIIGTTGSPWCSLDILDCIIAYNVGDGINLPYTGTTQYGAPCIDGCVIHGNGGDGIELPQTSSQTGGIIGTLIQNNEITFNSGYGINFSGSGINDTVLNAFTVAVRNNNFYSNTSGKYNPSTLTISLNEQTSDPSGGSSSATKDYTGTSGGSNFMSTVHKALGYPLGDVLAVGTSASSYIYKDIGLQHKDAGTSSGGGIYVG